MRASVDPIRDFTLDVLDVAREQASGLVDAGAGLLADGIDARVERLSSGIEELADKAPVVTVQVGRRRSRRPLVILILVVVVGGIAFALARRRSSPPPSAPPAPTPAPAPAPAG